MTGNLERTGMDRVQNEPIREGTRNDTIFHLSGKMERTRALIRARHNSYGEL